MFDFREAPIVRIPFGDTVVTTEAPVPEKLSRRRERRPVYSVESLIDRDDPHDAVFEDVRRPTRRR